MASAIPLPPDGDINRAPTLLAVTWLECSLSTLFVAARFYCRIKVTRNLWWDDWAILVTLVDSAAKSKGWEMEVLMLCRFLAGWHQPCTPFMRIREEPDMLHIWNQINWPLSLNLTTYLWFRSYWES